MDLVEQCSRGGYRLKEESNGGDPECGPCRTVQQGRVWVEYGAALWTSYRCGKIQWEIQIVVDPISKVVLEGNPREGRIQVGGCSTVAQSRTLLRGQG